MASPARLAAASLHLPVHPTTAARVAQYEREDLVDSMVAAALTAAMEEEEQKRGLRPTRASVTRAGFNSFPKENESVTFKNIMNFSDANHSDEEYFRKLKELKAAHAESMAKLEKMYQDKLNIKEVHPVVIREDSSSFSTSSSSEKTCPVFLVTSLSEPDLGQSPSLYTASDEELPSLEQETPEKSRVMDYAKELINNMWTGFSVQDYIQYDSDFQIPKKGRKKPKPWVPRITVPVPFQMMLREQKKGEALKGKSALEKRQTLLKRDSDEYKKQFRANPVPASVLLPLYEEMVRKNEERRRTTRERNKAAILASQKPFKFIAREEQKQAIREKQLRDLFKSKRKTKRFKARPVPLSTYRPAASDKSKEEELFRNIRMHLKARELLQSLSGPCGPSCKDPKSPSKSKYKPRCSSPDDRDFSEKQKEPFPEHSYQKFLSLCNQCGLLESPRESSKRQKTLADVRSDEENFKETCWPHLSSRRRSPVRNSCAKPRPRQYDPPAPTACSLGREQAIRKSDKARKKEYQQELEERDEKLQNRPMLFERVAQVVFVGM